MQRWLRLMAWLVTALVLGAQTGAAQEKPKTEAEQDGFAGPVKAVVTTVEPWTPHPLEKPITFTAQILCNVCAYDPDGMWTQKGNLLDGKFVGNIAEIDRDGSGRPMERRVYDTSTGVLQMHEVFGPHGRIEGFGFINGELFSRTTTRYDALGRPIEWLSEDGAGKQNSRSLDRLDKDGQRIAQTIWKGESELLAEDIYNPETDDEHFTSYDGNGIRVIEWRIRKGELLSFWQAEGSGPQYGDNFWDDLGDGKTEWFNCSDTGQCRKAFNHAEYVGSDHRNPKRVEGRDAAGNMLWTAEYEYAMDAHQNWTGRKVWVWTPELGERTLYETDTRTIEYWNK